jgi:hypothetical protein
LLAYKSRIRLDQGRWSEAVELTQQVLRDPRTMLARVPALDVLALVRARRGDPDCWTPADEALALAEPTGELQHMAPVAAARAELAWLTGQPAAVDEMTQAVLDLAIERRASWVVGELECWRWRVGLPPTASARAAEPYALEMAGDWAQAARSGPSEAARTKRRSRGAGRTTKPLRQPCPICRNSRPRDLWSRGAPACQSGARQVPRATPAAVPMLPISRPRLGVLELLVGGLRNAR